MLGRQAGIFVIAWITCGRVLCRICAGCRCFRVYAESLQSWCQKQGLSCQWRCLAGLRLSADRNKKARPHTRCCRASLPVVIRQSKLVPTLANGAGPHKTACERDEQALMGLGKYLVSVPSVGAGDKLWAANWCRGVTWPGLLRCRRLDRGWRVNWLFGANGVCCGICEATFAVWFLFRIALKEE